MYISYYLQFIDVISAVNNVISNGVRGEGMGRGGSGEGQERGECILTGGIIAIEVSTSISVGS